MIQQKMSQFVLSIFNHTSSTDSMKRRRHTGTSNFLSIKGRKQMTTVLLPPPHTRVEGALLKVLTDNAEIFSFLSY